MNVRDPDYRQVSVRDTRGPLFFYGLNIEYGENMIEIAGAENVFVLGAKTEPRGPHFVVRDSRNVVFAGLVGLRHDLETPLGVASHVRDFAVLGMYWPQGRDPLLLNPEDAERVTRNGFIGLYLRGDPLVPVHIIPTEKGN
jgi:hypothetical protein